MSRLEALSNIVIVLDEPQDVVNIAGVVRVMLNMGLSGLRLVNPTEFDAGRIDGIAHRSGLIVEAAECFEDLETAVADAILVVGTSARPRAAQTNALHPRRAAPRLLDRAADGVVAVVFGREDRGLTNEALDLCHEIVVVPTRPERASLNLAQACLVVCYELLLAAEAFAPETAAGRGKKARRSPPARREDLEQMYGALQDGLQRIDFFKAREAAAVMRTLRTLIGRAEPTLREARLLAAIGYELGHYLDRVVATPPSRAPRADEGEPGE